MNRGWSVFNGCDLIFRSIGSILNAMSWIFLAIAVATASVALYWLLVITEGVFLGQRVVVWLYDLTARKYDAIKQFDPEHEWNSIGEPLLKALAGEPNPLVLDVATGTGRVPALLLANAAFQGHVIGLDAASKMLALAEEKLVKSPNEAKGRASLIQQTVTPLPFQDDAFHAITCLEALEFFPSDVLALQEMIRVLRPGGFLMTSRRRGREARLFIGRYRTTKNFEDLLTELGFVEVTSHDWQLDYDMVTAMKPTARGGKIGRG